MGNNGRRLVVIPSDPISSYEQAGYASRLRNRYNPQKMFAEVFAVSPLEKGERRAHGITILGTPEGEFLRVLRNIQPHVVRAFGGLWPARLACRYRLPGVPVVVSVHDTNPSLLHKSVRYADLVICVSNAVKKLVKNRGTDPRRLRTLPNWIDTRVFRRITDEMPLQSVDCLFPPGKHILHIGRKAQEKNLDTLIQALKFLTPEYSCIFIGAGDRSPYVSFAEEAGVSERCFWVDWVENTELPLWYSWCDCMCVPSRWEGFGIVFIEAAACGVPIVTSNIAPMNEYLTHNRSACLVNEYENPQALAKAISKVCEDQPYRDRISAGAAIAAQPFDWRIVHQTEAAIYSEAMNLGPPSFTRRLEVSTWKLRETVAATIREFLLVRVARTVTRQFNLTRR